MSAPILFGSPRAQKNYINPKIEGVSQRTTNLGYTQAQNVSRYVIPPPPPVNPVDIRWGGENYGYISGKGVPNSANTIERYSFASDGNATTVGSLNFQNPLNFWGRQGVSSYSAGYDLQTGNNLPEATFANDIVKVPFASIVSNANIGEIAIPQRDYASHAEANVSGYLSGGTWGPQAPIPDLGPYPSPSFYLTDNIQKFPFASDAPSVSTGTLSAYTADATGGSDTNVAGYTVGETYFPTSGPPWPSTLPSNAPAPGGFQVSDQLKFPFATGNTSTNIANFFIKPNSSGVGQLSFSSCSPTAYFISGAGSPVTQTYDGIDKVVFANDTQLASTTATLLDNGISGASASSTTFGYTAGGYFTNNFYESRIQKFSMINDTNATVVGTLVSSPNIGGSGFHE